MSEFLQRIGYLFHQECNSQANFRPHGQQYRLKQMRRSVHRPLLFLWEDSFPHRMKAEQQMFVQRGFLLLFGSRNLNKVQMDLLRLQYCQA